MFCSKCGQQLPENAVFCQKCGTKVVAEVKETKPDDGNGTSMFVQPLTPDPNGFQRETYTGTNMETPLFSKSEHFKFGRARSKS